MSKIKEAYETDQPDDALKQFSEGLAPFAEVVDKQKQYAMFALGVKATEDGEGVQTYIAVSGIHGVIMEGLYAELAGQIEEGDLTLVSLLTEVLNDIHEDYNLDLEDDDAAPSPTSLH